MRPFSAKFHFFGKSRFFLSKKSHFSKILGLYSSNRETTEKGQNNVKKELECVSNIQIIYFLAYLKLDIVKIFDVQIFLKNFQKHHKFGSIKLEMP